MPSYVDSCRQQASTTSTGQMMLQGGNYRRGRGTYRGRNNYNRSSGRSGNGGQEFGSDRRQELTHCGSVVVQR